MLSWLPKNVSTYGADIDRIFYLIYYITAFSCVAVLLTLVFFLFKYRARPGGRATYCHGNTTLEIIWTIVPTLVFVMIGVMSATVWGQVKGSMPETDMTIMVQGSQFNWTMTYPGEDGRFGTEDDVKQENLMIVPVDAPIRVILTSKDVIHSFFVPQFRLKQDAVPGREIGVWFQATETGEYEIPCAELCGFGHSNMKGTLRVQSPQEFETWASDKKAIPQRRPGQ